MTALGAVNEGVYDHDIECWFTPEHIERMYLNNPLWATARAGAVRRPYELKRGRRGRVS